jgi:prophage tail gpP-like protein
MAIFPVDAAGNVDDRVRLVLGGSQTLLVEEYEVSIRFLQVPSAFAVHVGSSQLLAADIEQQYPPNTPFALMVGPSVTQFTGRTDGYDGPGGYTRVVLRGRDAMAYLVDDMIHVEKSFTNTTFEALTRACIEGAGIKGYSLMFDASATRMAVTGVPVVEWVDVSDETLAAANAVVLASASQTPGAAVGAAAALNSGELDAVPVVTTVTAHPIQAKAGMSWYAMLQKELDRAGLFLRAGVDPEGQDEFVFLLSAPSALQAPLCGLVNQRGAPRASNAVNVLTPRHKNDTSGRHAEYIVLGRGGSGDQGRQRIEGHFADQEMKALGFTKHFVQVDDQAKSTAQAVYLARRKAAEARRKGWSLVYPVRGHTAPLLTAPTQRAVWAPDTVVRVRDDELGIAGDFWIEGVTFRGGDNGTTTELTLMRPEDLLFGEGEFDSGPQKKGKGSSRRKS